MCSQGRISLGEIISPIPKKVEVALDSKSRAIVITPSDSNFSAMVDAMHRVFLPAWLRSRLPKGTREVLVVSQDGKRVLIPSTEHIEWEKISLDAFTSL